jgi:hypothetical protein
MVSVLNSEWLWLVGWTLEAMRACAGAFGKPLSPLQLDNLLAAKHKASGLDTPKLYQTPTADPLKSPAWVTTAAPRGTVS